MSGLAEQIVAATAAETLILSPASPYESAEKYLQLRCATHEGFTRIIYYRGDFYVWTGTHYREMSDAAAARAIAFSKELVIAPLTTDIATKAADYTKVHGLATADAIIFATANDARADLLTCDAHFAELPGVTYVTKRPA